MSDLFREQLSAFMDGELPDEECELLLKRVAGSAELTACWHSYHLIGDALNGELTHEASSTLAARVDRALDAAPSRPAKRWNLRRVSTMAAGVAVLGLAGLTGALVSRQMDEGQVLVPAAFEQQAPWSQVHTRVDWGTVPKPVRTELNRYLLMHEAYGAGIAAFTGGAAHGAAAALTSVTARSGGSGNNR